MADRLTNILGQLAEQGKLNGVLDILEKSASQASIGGSSSSVQRSDQKPCKSALVHMQINEHCWSVIV